MGLQRPPMLLEQTVGAATATRAAFETWTVDAAVVADICEELYPSANSERLLANFQDQFPAMCCGVTTAYLQHELQAGRPIAGSYNGVAHTYLRLAGSKILDITADQFGGPRLYYGQLIAPWSTRRPSGV